MLNRLLSNLQFQGQALSLRAERQSVLAGNIANADTPNFKARDFDFSAQLAKATGTTLPSPAAPSTTGGAGAAAPSTLSLATPGGATTATPGTLAMAGSNARHLGTGVGADGSRTTSSSDASMQYRTPTQASMDGNTVELDRERANFADNAVHYEATLRFINGNVRTILSAIKGE